MSASRALQFDIVLQKQNLTPHAEVHPAMYMPSHGEFLVERLAAEGLKPGLIFGMDDFALNGEILNQSSAEILILCGLDQHFSAGFEQVWPRLQKRYAKRVLIVSEPIFSPLAFYVSPHQNARVHHLRFLEAFDPDIVLYLSAYDVAACAQLGSRPLPLLYSLADPALSSERPVPWEAKQEGVLWLGKPQAWHHNRAAQGAWERQAQLQWWLHQQRIPFAWSDRAYSFRECYAVTNRFAFQLQPRSGYAFHSARTVQSALMNTIPVLLLPPEGLALLAEEAPFARPDHNLLVGIDGAYDALIDKLHDRTHMAQIAARLPELLAAGTITHSLRRLVQALLA
ncbi:MAG: hypothetical protein ACO1RX_19605 [Candidatus Sericytochromatia bacterium]